jgi:hypothetical protein
VAEEFGLITEIDRWVIDRAIEIAATGDAVEVNVSGRSINAPGLVDHIEHAIQRTGADPARIVFEITETALISDGPAARAFVETVHALLQDRPRRFRDGLRGLYLPQATSGRFPQDRHRVRRRRAIQLSEPQRDSGHRQPRRRLRAKDRR